MAKKTSPSKPKKPAFWKDLLGKDKLSAQSLCAFHGYSLIATIEDGAMRLALPRCKGKRVRVEIEEGKVTKVVGEG